jgi:hypothetical protein
MKQGKQLSVLKQTVEIISEIETKMTSESEYYILRKEQCTVCGQKYCNM